MTPEKPPKRKNQGFTEKTCNYLQIWNKWQAKRRKKTEKTLEFPKTVGKMRGATGQAMRDWEKERDKGKYADRHVYLGVFRWIGPAYQMMFFS